MGVAMSSFKHFINTQKVFTESDNKKIAVFTFGRFNPMTKGHQKLIDSVIQTANQYQGSPYIFLSHSNDSQKKDPTKIKNPLSYDVKFDLMQEAFPQAPLVKDQSVRTPHDTFDFFADKNYTDVYFVVGSDRIEEFKRRWVPYAFEYFDNAALISAGTRDPDAEGVAGMSATKAREAAIEGNIAKFRAATGWSGEFVNKLYHQVRKGLGVE